MISANATYSHTHLKVKTFIRFLRAIRILILRIIQSLKLEDK